MNMKALLYSPENPGNVGSIIRTSAALGLERIYVSDGFGLLSDNQASQRISDVSRGNSVEVILVDDVQAFIKEQKNKFATTLAKGSKRLGDPEYNVQIPEDALIMFGSEKTGLPRELSRRHGIQRIVIPTRGMNQCLSLPVAYGIVLFEYLRQHPNHFPQRGK